jgi:hypothetical protein
MNDGIHRCGLDILTQQEWLRVLRCSVHGGLEKEESGWRRKETVTDGPGALKTPQITRLGRVHLTRYHSLARLPSLWQMQAQPVVQQPQPVKIYNAVYSSVQVRAYVTFLTMSHHAFFRSTNAWYEVSRLCAVAPTPTSMPLKY